MDGKEGYGVGVSRKKGRKTKMYEYRRSFGDTHNHLRFASG